MWACRVHEEPPECGDTLGIGPRTRASLTHFSEPKTDSTTRARVTRGSPRFYCRLSFASARIVCKPRSRFLPQECRRRITHSEAVDQHERADRRTPPNVRSRAREAEASDIQGFHPVRGTTPRADPHRAHRFVLAPPRWPRHARDAQAEHVAFRFASVPLHHAREPSRPPSPPRPRRAPRSFPEPRRAARSSIRWSSRCTRPGRRPSSRART